MVGYAAQAVREKLGESATYSPPLLRPEERAKAEDLFLDLLDCPANEDGYLPYRAKQALERLGYLVESGLLRRLGMNVEFLARILADNERSEDHRRIARAGLRYVALEGDVISDSMGLIGFLDDYFVADLAVGLIDTDRLPWLDLIDSTIGAWPFLNMVVFENGQRGSPISEFLMVNSALVCPAVRGSECQPLTHVIVPRTGPLPLLLGFLASLGVLWKSRTENGHRFPFRPGQRVLVDGTAIRTFVGCRPDEQGRIGFQLRKDRTERGQRGLGTIEWFPVEHLYRLVPAEAKRATRGRVAFSAGRDEPLGPLDYLFLSAEPVTLPPDAPQVVVAAPVGGSRGIAEAVSIFGRNLCETLPMGHLTATGDICCWSNRFGSSRPAVLVIPDLDRACEYVEESGDTVFLTVVDSTGHNAGRHAALARLNGLGARTLVIASHANASDSLADDVDSTIWEWSRSDFESLFMKDDLSSSIDEPVSRYERGVAQALASDTEIVQVHAEGVAEAFHEVLRLKDAVELRDGDVPPELEEALSLSFNILTRLLRCPFPLTDHPQLLGDFRDKLIALASGKTASSYLTTHEIHIVSGVESSLRRLFTSLQLENPKSDALGKLQAAVGSLTVLCGDTVSLREVEGIDLCSATTAPDQYSGQRNGCVISGWFGRRIMTRLLRPPFSAPLHLILYDLEVQWYRSFIHRTHRESESWRIRSLRSQVFPGVANWSKVPARPPEADALHREKPEDGLDTVESRVMAGRRARLTALARPSAEDAAVEARLVCFDKGHAFLTDGYQAKLATHLLDPSCGREDAELELVPAAKLERGDVLLFLRGSSKDVIHDTADKMLPSGEREQAGRWRDALMKYREDRMCSIAQVWQALREHGCPLGLAAIRNWFENDEIISPLKVERELQAIIELTGDPVLQDGLQDCRDAITRVRGAHLRASRQLARRVLERAVVGLKSMFHGEEAVDLGDGIVLVRIAEIDDRLVRVRTSTANQLIEE
jgi:hypothetical protein